MFSKYVLRFAVLSLIASVSVWAQNSGSATIQGTVKDATGAVIPAAKVSITNLDTGVKNEAAANNEGRFVFPPVQNGRYKAHCEAPGMKAWEQEVVLDTGATVELNAILSLGAVTETVMVSADIPLVTTTEPTDATTLD